MIPQKVIFFLQGINHVSEEVLAQKRILKDLKEEKTFEVENYAISFAI